MKYAILKTDEWELASKIARDASFGKALGIEILLVLPLESVLLTGVFAKEELERTHKAIHKVLEE